jgi:hypothetical protein
MFKDVTETETGGNTSVPVEEIQRGWHALTARVTQLEAEKALLEQENKDLRFLLERAIELRQKSHGELVLLLTSLVSKLPINDVGVVVSRLVEHNTNVSQALAALIKGTAEVNVDRPAVLKTLEQTKRELSHGLKPLIEELVRLGIPLENELLQGLPADPELFFSPRFVRAIRGFVKGQVPRERIIREFGDESIVFFNDMTTDPKLNPNPKREEILLGFKSDFEALFQQNPSILPAKRQDLQALHQKVQRSKASTEEAQLQKSLFQKLTFLAELLHFYENQNTEAPDVIFAQRLPALVEQLVLAGPQQDLDEKLIANAESLMAQVINPDHRQMIVNNIGKGGATARTLKYVLSFRGARHGDQHQLAVEFVKHLVPLQKAPPPQAVVPVLRLLKPDMQRLIVLTIYDTDRLRKEDARNLALAVAKYLGLEGIEKAAQQQAQVSPEVERQIAWTQIRELIVRRNEPAAIAAAIRDRLNAKYDAEEMKQSWIALMEAEPIALIRIFCQIPYRSDGKTDSIARPVMETYVTRLMHEKYAGTYHKVVNSLKNMFRAKPDSPTLVNFLALVKWVDPEAEKRLSQDIGLPVHA